MYTSIHPAIEGYFKLALERRPKKKRNHTGFKFF